LFDNSISNGRGIGEDDGEPTGEIVGGVTDGDIVVVGAKLINFVGETVGFFVRLGFCVGLLVITIGAIVGDCVGGGRGFTQPVYPKHVSPGVVQSVSSVEGQGLEQDVAAAIQFVPQ